MGTVQEAERSAAQMLDRSWWPDHELPVNPFALAEGLGIIVRRSRLRADESGNISLAPDRAPVITVNANDHLNRQSFTCAHEIAHYLRWSDGGGATTIVDYRKTLAGLGIDSDEIWANQFAAALLMPSSRVQAYVKAGISIAEMSQLFRTSPQAMELRLRNLGLSTAS